MKGDIGLNQGGRVFRFQGQLARLHFLDHGMAAHGVRPAPYNPLTRPTTDSVFYSVVPVVVN